MVDAARGQSDCVRDRGSGGVSVRDYRQPAQAEEIGTSVGVGVEALAQMPRRRPDQEAADLPTSRRADLLADPFENSLDRALEQLEADVAGEAVTDDHVAGAIQQMAALDVAAEVEVGGGEER